MICEQLLGVQPVIYYPIWNVLIDLFIFIHLFK